MCNVKDFTFLTLVYNHENYIIEHLESIKYLVENYGSGINVNLIINDDKSKDKSIKIIDQWINVNSGLFHEVTKLYNETNLGTCQSIINMLDLTKTRYAKMTAGDDVYSFENIFELSKIPNQSCPLAYCYPLQLIDGQLSQNNRDIFQIIGTDKIYKAKSLIDRFIFPSNNNAPNMFFDMESLNNDLVKDFLKEFDVVEDKPISVKISETLKDAEIAQLDFVMTYYRRTPGSIYLVANKRFNSDQIKIFNHLIDTSDSLFRKLVSINRLYCFKSNSKIIKRCFNIGNWYYLTNFVYKIPIIYKTFKNLDLKQHEHQKHYNLIRKNSTKFYEKIKENI